MKATPGDRLVVHDLHGAKHLRDAEIIEVHGTDGEPPYLVRWGDTGHEGLVFPGPDATVQPADTAAGATSSED
jgi:hypothetical protein